MMTKIERRIRSFSLGMKKLGIDSRNYIHMLTQNLFLIEQISTHPALKRKGSELETQKIRDTAD